VKAEFRYDNLRKEEVVEPIDPKVVASDSHKGQIIYLNSAPPPSPPPESQSPKKT
jgi:hypothetical protein